MKGNLKSELWKAFHNKMFLLALAVGLLMSAANILQNSATVAEMTESTLRLLQKDPERFVGGHGGFSLFMLWLLIYYSLGSLAFDFYWPILAALPYGWSYLKERRSGVYDQIVSRMGKKAYFRAKYVAVFLSGGAVVGGTALFDLLVNALICPVEMPSIAGLPPVFNGHFLSMLYFRNPWLFCLAFCGLAFLWGGVTGTLCLAVGTLPRFQVFVILFPYLLYYVCNMIYFQILQSFGSLPLLSPLLLIQAAPTTAFNPGWAIFGVMGVIALLGSAIGYWQVTRREFS